jgi:hypothetical protein
VAREDAVDAGDERRERLRGEWVAVVCHGGATRPNGKRLAPASRPRRVRACGPTTPFITTYRVAVVPVEYRTGAEATATGLRRNTRHTPPSRRV